MLPAGSRLHTSEEFATVVRLGRRSASPRLVAHLLLGSPVSRDAAGVRVGFVVSGKVGNAVVRHRVTRRLRVQIAPLLATLPPGTDVVARALPAAATATSAELARDLRSAVSGALRKARGAAAGGRPGTPVGAVR